MPQVFHFFVDITYKRDVTLLIQRQGCSEVGTALVAILE